MMMQSYLYHIYVSDVWRAHLVKNLLDGSSFSLFWGFVETNVDSKFAGGATIDFFLK